MAKTSDVVPIKPSPCPMCGKAMVVEFRPFCSKRCADLDLGRWFNESYRMPTEETADLDDLEALAGPSEGDET